MAKECGNYTLIAYSNIYSEASKYKHSDISSLDIYKESISRKYSKNYLFKMDMNK